MFKRCFIGISALLLCWHSLVFSESLPSNEVRVGVLVSGSVHWEIEALISHEFDIQNNVRVKPVLLGSVNALLVALQGGAVDIVVSDWTWVANQYWKQRFFKFAPFSTATGGILAKVDKPIESVTDLIGKRLGVAGGPEGKSWLVLKAYAQHKYAFDITKQSTIKFAAPPIVNALINTSKIDAGLNYWHFNAQLEGEGFHTILSVQQMLNELGVETPLPMLGWVFQQKWANNNKELVDRFLLASRQTKDLLQKSDEAWLPLRKLMRVDTEAKFERLRNGFRAGIPVQFGASEIKNIIKTNQLLQKQYGLLNSVKASDAEFPEDVFWYKGDVVNENPASR
jgi:NitT/TauT family transport system substrate-binding protein